jgi:hypothetical protein
MRIRRTLLLIAGFISLALGTLGIFLPILPTTPFVLLSAACFIRSSRRFYIRLIANPLFGPLVENYLTYRAVPLRTKMTAILMLWVLILISLVLFAEVLWLRILLICIALGVTTHLVLLKTLTEEMKGTNQAGEAVRGSGREK